jgi:hypothetical protein
MARAAPGHQHQNFVERSVQNIIKGVSCLLCDQSSLTFKWWDYAVEHWVHVSDCLPHQNEWLHQPSSPQEVITKVAFNISTRFLFLLSCPVTSIPPTQRDWNYAASGELGIAVGFPSNNNGATLVFILGRGIKPFLR